MGVSKRVSEWVERRFQVKHLMAQAHRTLNLAMPITHMERYKSRIFWIGYPLYYLGSISVVLFLILCATGIILGLYYVPSAIGAPGEPTPAYRSVELIMTRVPLGYILRSIHHWSANLLIASVTLHLLRVFFTSAYREPREINWILGVILLAGTLFISFSGYLLPWDQLGYWASTIGLEMTKSVPIFGETLAQIVFGGSSMGPATLTRMYSFHVNLSMVGFGLIALHLILVFIQGIAEPH
ncbi:MAG: cytochrome bc complex cytochrome b subunit [Candidatus Geothermarchaeales archaeon]